MQTIQNTLVEMSLVLAEAVRNIRGAMEERERKRRKKDCNVTE